MRIVVVGAGIAGLVAAVAAHRAGHEVTVIERSSTGSAAGAGISLFGNALRGLDSIEIRVVVDRRRAKFDPWAGDSLLVRSWVSGHPAGRWLVRSTVRANGQWAKGSDVAVVHRADLQNILLRELPSGVVHFSSSFQGVTQGQQDAEVSWRTADDQRKSFCDIVIAADGINSALRRACWTDDPGVRYSGYTSWRGLPQDHSR